MVSGHGFRHKELLQVLPFREYIRNHCPSSDDGLDMLDLDLVPLIFGSLAGRDRKADGRFMLVEVKHGRFNLADDYKQKRLLQMMHRLLRQADPDREHYIGCYVLNWDNPEGDLMRCPDCGKLMPKPEEGKPLAINSQDVTEGDFYAWITGLQHRRSLFE